MKMKASPDPSSTAEIRRCMTQTSRAAGATLASSHTGFKTGSRTAMGAAPEISPVRRLVAVLAADVAGYSRLMGADEEGTYERLKAHLAELVHPKITERRGRVVKNMGDGLLAEFASVVDAVRCAVEMQRGMAERNAGIAAPERIEFRVGINIGDVIAESDDIFGDGVNVAARLETLAEPGGICVSRVVRDQVRDRLHYIFEDMGEQSVKNIARPVRVYQVGDVGPVGTNPSAPALPLPDKPSIAVLPFQNMSGDQEQEYFADGMVEEIITALSRIRWLFVIARNSSFTYKGKTVGVKQVGRELGVHYVLEGSVRKARNRVRITAQLIDALSGTHLWADHFDGSLEDVFDLQDNVALSVVGVIEPTLEAAETRRSSHRPTGDVTAYDLYLQAREERYSFERNRVVRALGLLKQAIARDPGYAPALALAGMCHLAIALNNWTDDFTVNRRHAVRLARRALQSGADDPVVLTNAGLLLGYFGEDIHAALRLVDRALVLNPSYGHGWDTFGWLHVFAGHTEVAIPHFESSLRLDPRRRRGLALSGIGVAHFFNKQFQEALERLVLSLEELPTFFPTYRVLAACYAHMGRLTEAQKVMERLRAMNAGIMSGSIPYRNSEHRDLYISGLRMAAGEAVWAREKLATALECEPAGLIGVYSSTTTGGDAYFSERWPPSPNHHPGAVLPWLGDREARRSDRRAEGVARRA
jgi:TolB-like protein/class 3 adenylate cyclase